jgi:hypothetical protein
MGADRRAWLALIYCLTAHGGSALAAESPLGEVALFNRCYQHLTQKRPATGHPLLVAVTAGTMTALDACMSVLDQARLGVDGKVPPGNADGLLVLRTLNDFHRSWFPSDSMHASLPVGDCTTYDLMIHDQQEPGLHVTRALLQSGARYSDIVTGTSALEALRSGGEVIDSNVSTSTGATTTAPVAMALVEFGGLQGVRPIDQNASKAAATVRSVVGPISYGGVFAGDIQVHQSAGGGILGTKSYMILNFNRPDMLTMNGGLRMARNFSKNVFRDLLCRDVPLLRPTDGALYVQPVATGRPPFRNGASCMSCHASMDPLAATARNYSLSIAPSYICVGTPGAMDSIQMAKWPVTQPREIGPVDSDPDYHQRPPNGKLVFRSYSGKLIDQEVAGVSGLGQALADTDDLYACAASRYFEFFTGLQIPLYDPGSPTAPRLTTQELEYQKRVITLGQNLKKSQSLRSLIQEIMSLGLYRLPSMRTWKGGTP